MDEIKVYKHCKSVPCAYAYHYILLLKNHQAYFILFKAFLQQLVNTGSEEGLGLLVRLISTKFSKRLK
jgi:hypothetical protein